MKKSISILGSTGSIGLSTLKIINKNFFFFDICLLSANKNFNLICKQIKYYKPKYFVILDPTVFAKVKKKFKNKKTLILNSFDILKIKKKIDITVSAIPGIAGLAPTISMIKKSNKLLIANKEAVICGWELIKSAAKKNKTKIIPIDSEHYSIFKLLQNYKLNEIKKIYLTASGGPFLNYNEKQLKKIKPKDALKHPKWRMGKKISIDSSTLMNKILEIVEAQKLFNISNKMLEIIIHPNSLVHAIISLKNGLSIFIYHETFMLIPIANAIYDGKLDIDNFLNVKNKKNNHFETLIFNKVNKKIFPLIKLKDSANEHPSTPIIINASNEILVDQFLQKKIAFLHIFKIIMTILKDKNYKKYAIRKPKNIKQINLIDNWAKNTTLKIINKNYV
jgi:1-deoxy-D-xylulose-5-phosphate reductoisomerase